MFTGENSIVIVLGANESLTPEYADSAVDVIKSASVLLCQFEIPLETTLHALKLHRGHGLFLFYSFLINGNISISLSQTIVSPKKKRACKTLLYIQLHNYCIKTCTLEIVIELNLKCIIFQVQLPLPVKDRHIVSTCDIAALSYG